MQTVTTSLPPAHIAATAVNGRLAQHAAVADPERAALLAATASAIDRCERRFGLAVVEWVLGAVAAGEFDDLDAAPSAGELRAAVLGRMPDEVRAAWQEWRARRAGE